MKFPEIKLPRWLKRTRKEVTEPEGFAALMQAARRDPEFAALLQSIVSLPQAQRQMMVEGWVRQCDAEQVPEALRGAMRHLQDERIATRTHEVLLRFQEQQAARPPGSTVH